MEVLLVCCAIINEYLAARPDERAAITRHIEKQLRVKKLLVRQNGCWVAADTHRVIYFQYRAAPESLPLQWTWRLVSVSPEGEATVKLEVETDVYAD